MRHTLVIFAVTLLLGAPAQGAPMSIIYDTDGPARTIFHGTTDQPGLGLDRGGYRQEPSTGHLFAGERDAPYRIAKVSSRELLPLGAPQMAARLRTVIDDGCTSDADGIFRDWGCESHLVGVDEITTAWAGAPGMRLAQAMAILAGTPSPWGASYADRVHLYIAPGVHTSIAAGRGPRHTLGRDGKPHFRDFTAVGRAWARAGGIWLEMYHGVVDSPRQDPLTRVEWRTIPARLSAFIRRSGGSPSRLHFLFTHIPPGAYGCSEPQACAWALAAGTPAGARILANGPGAYRVAEQAPAWLGQYNARFGA